LAKKREVEGMNFTRRLHKNGKDETPTLTWVGGTAKPRANGLKGGKTSKQKS